MEISIIGLFVIALGTVFYIGRPFFMPLFAAFVVGTMMSPAASWLERHRVPRAVGATLIVSSTFAALVLVIGLISAPLPDWIAKFPDAWGQMREKFHVFDRLFATIARIENALTGTSLSSGGSFQMPRIDWMQPTLEYLSPTLAEIVLFFVTLFLFVASWPDLRRRLILVFSDRPSRLRVVRILNAIEGSLGGYLSLVLVINLCVGVATALICLVTGMPNPAGLGALAATLNFIPILGPIAMFVVLVAVGLVSFPTISGGLLAAALFAFMTFLEGHFITPAIIGRRLELNALAVFIALAFWTWMWGPMGAFLASPLLIIIMIIEDSLFPNDDPQLPGEK